MDRLRWDNIARAAAVIAMIALIVAWPHLRSKEPAMPAAAPTPVSVQTAPQVTERLPPATAQVARPRRPRRAAQEARRRAPEIARRPRAAKAATKPLAAAAPPAPARAPAAAPPPPRHAGSRADQHGPAEFALP